MKVKVTQLYPTLCDPMDCNLPSSSVHSILQARIPERVAIPFSRGPSQHRSWTVVSCIADRFFTIWISREALYKSIWYYWIWFGKTWLRICIYGVINWSVLIAYNEQCQIHDLWKIFSFRTRDQAWSLKSFCVSVLLKWKRDRELLIQTSEGGQKCPLTSLTKALYTFTRPTPTISVLR